MNERFSIEPETGAEFGKNIKVKILFTRHGNYDRATGHLNEEGLAQAEVKGYENAPIGSGDHYIAKPSASEFPRTQQTATKIVDSMSADRTGNLKIRPELGSAAEDFCIGDMDHFLDADFVETDGVRISADELAGRVARTILHYIRMSEHFKNDSKVDLVNTTHLPWILAFLKKAFGDELIIDPGAEKYVDKIGGSIDYVESFTVYVERRSKKDFSLKVLFRDREYDLSQEKLLELAQK